MDTAMDVSQLGQRFCKHPKCGRLLVQNEKEANSKFARREHCNGKCSSSNPLLHKAQSDQATALRNQKYNKICVVCDNIFYRNRTEGQLAFEKRETCCRKCCDRRRVLKNREEMAKNPKICENPDCKKEFTRRTTGIHIETEKNFNKRKACSPECAPVVRRQNSQNIGYKKTRKPPTTTTEPLKREIPSAPQPEVIEVWRPASWGGPKLVRTR